MFGEYYPMRGLLDFLRSWINIPYSDLTPGPLEQELMQVNGSILGMSICFEDVFSRDILLSLPAANLLVNLSNDAWFGNSTAPHQHMQIAQMRSQETGRVMMRATNTGVTAFIDHKGRIIAQSEQFKTQSISEEVQGRSGTTPFYYFAMIQGELAILLIIGALLISSPVGWKIRIKKDQGSRD
jgi:apolipoprotein N-acyltransferase